MEQSSNLRNDELALSSEVPVLDFLHRTTFACKPIRGTFPNEMCIQVKAMTLDKEGSAGTDI